jgi:hypothetical protein
MRFSYTLSWLPASIATVYSSSTPQNATQPIVTTKVTPSYWRATFVNPPFNLEDNAWFASFYALVDTIAHNPDVKVVVFDSSAPDFYIAHFDIINPVLQDYVDGIWSNFNSPRYSPRLDHRSRPGHPLRKQEGEIRTD